MNAGTGFIKTNMTINSNAKNLQIDATGIFYHLFVLTAMFFDVFFFYLSIWYMSVFWININMIEKVHLHKALITLQRIITNRIILVKIKGDDIFKAQHFFLMHSY